MKMIIRLALAIAALLALASPAFAQLDNANVQPNCNTVTYPSSTTRALVQTTAGLLCTSASASGTFTDAATGSTGSAVPGSAAYTGVNIGGNLVGQTGYSTGASEKAGVVIEGGNSYKHIATATTTLVKTGAGTLHTICINTLGTVASTVEFDDATTHTTPVIGILNSLTSGQGCYTYDIAFATGLSVTTTGTAAPDITISFR